MGKIQYINNFCKDLESKKRFLIYLDSNLRRYALNKPR